MSDWADFEAAAPELATAIRGCFEASREGTLASIRKDGSPRISGVETLFWDGDVWVGMMPGSRKGVDLRRDPRFALHSATAVPEKTADAKLSGLAIPFEDSETIEAFRQEFMRQAGYGPEGPMELFQLDIAEAALTYAEGEELVIESWRSGEPPQVRRRR